MEKDKCPSHEEALDSEVMALLNYVASTNNYPVSRILTIYGKVFSDTEPKWTLSKAKLELYVEELREWYNV